MKISHNNTQNTITYIYYIITTHIYIFSTIPIIYNYNKYNKFPNKQSNKLFPKQPNKYNNINKQKITQHHHYNQKQHQTNQQKKTYT